MGLVIVYLGFLTVGFVFHFVPPTLPEMILDLGLTHSQAGLFMSLFALPAIFLSFAAGWLVDRFGERLVGGLGLLVMGAATLSMTLADGFPLLMIARVGSGIGATLAVVALQRQVTRLFQGRSLGLPMGISGSAIPVGIILVLNVAGPLAEAQGWRVVAGRVGGVTMAVAVIYVLANALIFKGRSLGLGDTSAADEPTADQKTAQAQGMRILWYAGVVWFCANGAMTAFMTFAPDNYLTLGFGVQSRGLFTSIPMWCSAALGPVAGWLADRHGGKPAFIALGMTLMAVCLALIPGNAVSPLLIGVGLGTALAAMVTPLLTLPGQIMSPAYVGRAFGLLSTCANLGIFLVPPLAGLVRDHTGQYLWAFVLMASTAALGAACSEVLRRKGYLAGFRRHL